MPATFRGRGCHLLRYPRARDLLQAFAAKKCNTLVMAGLDLVLASKEHPELARGIPVGRRGSAAWAVAPGSEALRDELSRFINTARSSNSWYTSFEKYFGEPGVELMRALNR